jgi:hypothetical protein
VGRDEELVRRKADWDEELVRRKVDRVEELVRRKGYPGELSIIE